MTAFVIAAGETARFTLDSVIATDVDPDTITVAGLFDVSANKQTLRTRSNIEDLTITNNGTIFNSHPDGDGRGIRFETDNAVVTSINVTIDNNGLIDAGDDAIQLQISAVNTVTAGQLIINNIDTIKSNIGSAIDVVDAAGTFSIAVNNSANILSQADDAIKVGGVLININNFGTINGGTNSAYSGSDGIAFADDAEGTLTNLDDAGGLISGDRHAVDAGTGSTINVVNGADLGPGNLSGAMLEGRNGSGVGSDGTATILNYGTLSGNFSNSAGSDINGSMPGAPNGGGPDGTPDGDGDGVDVDGEITLDNYGRIEGNGAGGTGSDGRANTSEGVAAGGGTIINYTGATITGLGLGILIDDSSTGNAPFKTSITNEGTINGSSSYAIRIISDLDDEIYNNGLIFGGAGVAILFGTGDNTLSIGDSSSITGASDGGAGNDTLDYSQFGTGVTVSLDSGTPEGTGGVLNFENLRGSANNDVLSGAGGENKLEGGDGDDLLDGGGGADTMMGGAGDDKYIYINVIDTISEAGGDGFDTVRARVDYTMDAGIEVLAMIGAQTGTGNGDNNLIVGGLRNETLLGMGGNDKLIGGGGKDTLTGGTGADIFSFYDRLDSVLKTSASDRITDFSKAEGDRISLSVIDANTTLGADQAFSFDGATFSGSAGSLRSYYSVLNSATMVQGDVNGDGQADFQIVLESASNLNLTAADFYL